MIKLKLLIKSLKYRLILIWKKVLMVNRFKNMVIIEFKYSDDHLITQYFNEYDFK